MLSVTLRPTQLRSVTRRFASSKARAQRDAKMRSLVSLYHQSETFITPENLSEVIDDVFVRRHSPTSNLHKEHTLVDLMMVAKTRRAQPKYFFGYESQSTIDTGSMGPGWDESKTDRRDRIREALLGTDSKQRPSWSVLKEEAKRVEEQLEHDRPYHRG
ncbi:hypothetical protein SERLA73DRAFT_177174 [Serpula lacrymans var. lacrymans S7.3]|uniref:Uncharacterized protein n=2 Tax=Serpula lacrymans var. lacrymans TaxID=341189 RepID=F8PNJ4_SERL3|nr:uncharacterized protein SERLADRAFT_460640 [Serpula lacrymans var. lacrymans S7.9]EGO01721.1 hypothetical protein SERLA73DRAFT_177174 [Serpula lacrymans var. lacrymans S7.3]EGO27364.1 hypothetical protein SERLADRAFT_460640 [Serpula lacrymans var. lacrymans S7.9]